MALAYDKDLQPCDISLQVKGLNISDYKGNIRGVYALYNTEVNRVYIGSSKNILHRIRAHYKALKEGMHYNPAIQEDANKYGVNSFKFVLLSIVASDKPEDLIQEENEYIMRFNALDAQAGYNTVEAFTKNYYVDAEKAKEFSKRVKGFIAGKGYTLRSLVSYVNKVSAYNPEVLSMCYQNISNKLSRGTIDVLELENMFKSIGYKIEFVPIKN